VRTSIEVAVFGAVRLGGAATFATLAPVDLRSSAWLGVGEATASFATATSGDIVTTATAVEVDGTVAPISYVSACAPGILCGDSDRSGKINASDALLVLRVAGGLNTCLPSVCDVDSSGKITAADALRVLKKAVGTALEPVCPVA
ncbi:MAG: hypothetical protein HY899_19825, partial [Deltaproteobacteria bacterium]|nr:hypothetical protein [Deltaproteobacteria bacterium]